MIVIDVLGLIVFNYVCQYINFSYQIIFNIFDKPYKCFNFLC